VGFDINSAGSCSGSKNIVLPVTLTVAEFNLPYFVQERAKVQKSTVLINFHV
jgi:hypothetical protein